MTNHAPQKSTCQRLAELVELDTEFYWCKVNGNDVVHECAPLEKNYPAPLLSELLEVMPDEEMLEKINKLYKQGHKIIYHTARHPDYYGQTYAWLVENGAYFTDLEMGKLTADVYIDDKALNVDDVDRLLDNPDEL